MTKLFLTFCINHTPKIPAIKTIRAHVCSATNPTALPKKLRWHQQHFLRWQVMPQRPSPRVFWVHLLTYLTIFSRPLSFGGEPPVPSPPSKSPMIESTVAAIPAQRVESPKNIVIICSRITIRIFSGKDIFWSRTFSRICLILTNCVWRSFRFCDSIYSLACFSVFKSSNLSLYNRLCSSE